MAGELAHRRQEEEARLAAVQQVGGLIPLLLLLRVSTQR